MIQLAERRGVQKKKKEEAKRNRPWRNVPEYRAKCKRRAKGRPAKANSDAVRAYRLRVIQQTKSALQSPAPLVSRSTTTVRFKVGHDVQTFDLGQPANAISKRVDGKAELSLTAAEKKFIHEDD